MNQAYLLDQARLSPIHATLDVGLAAELHDQLQGAGIGHTDADSSRTRRPRQFSIPAQSVGLTINDDLNAQIPGSLRTIVQPD